MTKRRRTFRFGGRRRRKSSLGGCGAVVVVIILAALGLFQDNRKASPTPAAQVRDTSSTTRATITPIPVALRPTSTSTSTTRRPTSTPRPTREPPQEEAVAVTALAPEVYYARETANVRACPTQTCERLGQLDAGQSVEVTGLAPGQAVSGSGVWYQVIYNEIVGYVHSSLMTRNPTVRTVPDQPPSPQPESPSFVCPRNCDEAVAMGLTAQQAASCPRLDRDGDGLACYGD